MDKLDYALKSRNLMNDVYYYGMHAIDDNKEKELFKKDWKKLTKRLSKIVKKLDK